jgi:hypothetical protein
VVSEPDAIKAIRFRLLRNGADRLIRTLAVVFAVVRQEDHQPNLHGLPSTFFGTRYLLIRSVLLRNPQTLLSSVHRICKGILSGVLVHLLQLYAGNRRESFLIDRIFTEEHEKIVYRPTVSTRAVLYDIKHETNLETVSLKDVFGSSVYHTLHHRASGRTISFLFFLIMSKLFHIAIYPLIF